MRKIAHLSDFHFGNTNDFLLEPLLACVADLNPDLTVLSGDFVERATESEFHAASEYIARLPQPQLTVAGNHDLPFYDPWRRYSQGLRLYRLHIATDLEPIYRDEEMLVMGLNTPRLLRVRGGRINTRQVESILRETADLPKSLVKVVVTHHPLDLPLSQRHSSLVIHARRTVDAIAPSVDLLLAGHIHLSSTGGTAARYKDSGHSVVFAQAGTATSRRNKGEPNSFNFIRLDSELMLIQHYTWQDEQRRFAPREEERFEHTDHGWVKRLPGDKTAQVIL